MNISRRSVLAGLAATAAISAMPSAVVEAAALPPSAPAAPTARGWWGYSINGGEWWHGPYDSREEALQVARGDHPEEEIETALCIPRTLDAPDLREQCVFWLMGDHLLQHRLDDLFVGANEDSSYEGEVEEAFWDADFNSLVADMRDATAAALFRAGRSDLIAAVYRKNLYGPITEDDDLCDRLGSDAQFEADLDAAAMSWMIANNVIDAPRVVDIQLLEEHQALNPEQA